MLQHSVAMADGLVAGQPKASVDVAGRADEAFFGGGVHFAPLKIVVPSLLEPLAVDWKRRASVPCSARSTNQVIQIT